MTTKIDLMIVAAGVGSRLNASVPKALVPITDISCLTTTLQQIGDKFRNVYIVTNIKAHEQWKEYFTELNFVWPNLTRNIIQIEIESGLGDGHAVMTALKQVYEVATQEIVIAWGDVFFQHPEIIDELLIKGLEFADATSIIPAVMEKNPYVALVVDDECRCRCADFSKYGEVHLAGYHDQSVFYFDKYFLLVSLEQMHRTLWKDRRYIAVNGELSLLYAFHYLYNLDKRLAAKVYETKWPTLSFNTPEEVASIQQEIKDRWIKLNEF